MGNCAHHCRFSSQRRIDPKQVSKNRFLSPQLKNKNNQIVLTPFQYLSAPKQTKINTSNTHTSTQHRTSLVDVIDEYNQEIQMLQYKKIKNKLNMIQTQSYQFQPLSSSSRREIVKSQAKKMQNYQFQKKYQREVNNHKNKDMAYRQNFRENAPTLILMKTTTRY